MPKAVGSVLPRYMIKIFSNFCYGDFAWGEPRGGAKVTFTFSLGSHLVTVKGLQHCMRMFTLTS